MGSIIFEDVLQASAKRVEFEYISIVLLKACWAPDVMLIYIQEDNNTDMSRTNISKQLENKD